MNDEKNNNIAPDENEKESEQDDVVFEENYENTERDAKEVINKLRQKLKDCEKEKAVYLDGWQRAKADFINLRKKDEETNKELLKYAKETVIIQLIPVLDSFEMAFSNKEEWEKSPKEWRVGIESIYSQLLNILEKNHVKQVDPKGEDFNPMFHEAVDILRTKDKTQDNKVVDVIQKGYVLYEKVIKTAKVRVGEFTE